MGVVDLIGVCSLVRKMDHSDTIHKLADATFRNVDELAVNLKKIITVGRNLAKAMEDVIPIAEEFTSLVDTIGSKAGNLPGGVRNLGICLKEIATANRKLGSAYADWTTSINTDLVVPLEDKLEREQPNIIRNWKGYKNDTSKQEAVAEKTSVKLKTIRKKKLTAENMERENQLCHILEDQQRDLHSTRVEGLRKALMDQQKMYSFLIFHLCGVHHTQIEYSSVAYQALSTKINSWSTLTSNTEELPQESLVLLKNPHSPDAYKLPDTVGTQFSFETTDGMVQHKGRSVQNKHDFQQTQKSEQQQQHKTQITAADIRNIKAEAQENDQTRKRRPSCRVKALHLFESNEQGRLNLKIGDLVDAFSEEKDGWLYGSNSNTKESGWFPCQYVDKVWWPTPETVHRQVSTPAKTTLAPDLPDRDYLQKKGNSPVINRKMFATQPHGSPKPLSSQLTSHTRVPPTANSISNNRAPLPNSGPPPPPAGAATPSTGGQNPPPKKQLSFSDMIKQRASYQDDCD